MKGESVFTSARTFKLVTSSFELRPRGESSQ